MKNHNSIGLLNGQASELKALFDPLSVLVQVHGPVAQLGAHLGRAPPGGQVVDVLLFDISLGAEELPHKVELLLRGRLGAARVELLVEQVDNRDVVVDVEIVEKRFSDLDKRKHFIATFLAWITIGTSLYCV